MTVKKEFLYGAPFSVRPASIGQSTMEPSFGVRSKGDNVVLDLGTVPAFELPKETAIKLALLILKHVGVQVDHG